MNEAAQRRLFLDDARVVLDVGRARHAVGEGGDVRRPADFVEVAGARELFLQRDEVDRVAALAEHHHPIEDAAMRVAEEVLGVDQLGGVIERLVVDQDCAEYRFLGIEAVR